MILEGIVTTQAPGGALNIAPMGPQVDAGMARFLLKPFRTSNTYNNLIAHGEGVFHVIDDVRLLAQAALGLAEADVPLVPAAKIRGQRLADCCRFYEFRVAEIDDRDERVRITVETVHCERVRDFFGFNRAKHAVLEAAILATRTDFLPLDEIAAELARLKIIVAKTGADQEHQGFALIENHVAHVKRVREEKAP